jgi:tetratricopeptide (TPR) repeat protein
MLTKKKGERSWKMENSVFHYLSSMFRPRFTMVMLALALAGCSPPGPRALLEGKRLLDSGHYADAVEELKTATSLLNTNAQAWNYLGLAYQYNGEPTNAIAAYGQALKLDRDLVEAHWNLGCLWLEQNRLENAKAELAAFTLRRPASVEGWLKLASAQLRSRELNAAEKSFNEVLRLSAQNPEALNGLGVIQMQRNRARDSLQFFNAALKQQPNYAPALLNLAIVSHSPLNNKPFALQKYREYLATSPRPANWDSVNSIANALEQELNAASRPVTPIVVTQVPANVTPSKPSNAAPVVVRSNSPVKQEPPPSNTGRMLVTTQSPPPVEVVKVTPQPEARVAQDTTAASNTSHTTSDSESQPASPQKKSFLQKINPLNLFKHNPKTTSAQSASGANSNPVAAPISTARNSSTDPSVVRYAYHHPAEPELGDRSAAEKFFAEGLREHKALHYPEAIQAYRKAVEADPAYFEAYYNLAIAASGAGSVQTALDAGEMALTIRPDSIDARLNFAQSLKQGGYVFDAANELAVVLSRNPNEPRAHLALGNLYAQEFHQPEKAREHYLKVLDLDPRNPQAGAIRDWIVANPPR